MEMKTWLDLECTFENDERRTSQEELQKMAKMIRKNCKVIKITTHDNHRTVCTICVNESLRIKYWIKDRFGYIEEITEGRSY